MTVTAPAPTIAQIVGQNVRVELTKQRWSVNRAAAQLGWTQPYMSRRVNGVNTFDAAELTAISRLLGVPVSAFFEGVDAAEVTTLALQERCSDQTELRRRGLHRTHPKRGPRSRTDARRPGETTCRYTRTRQGRGTR